MSSKSKSGNAQNRLNQLEQAVVQLAQMLDLLNMKVGAVIETMQMNCSHIFTPAGVCHKCGKRQEDKAASALVQP